VKDDRIYLGHILEAVQDIQRYASAGRDAFLTDRMRQDALIHKLEVIGLKTGSRGTVVSSVKIASH
jgi:uncharacterized protein with HEPN domain